MADKKDRDTGNKLENKGLGCCHVESVVSVDERGQMVLPKEIRAKANIQAGDKLAIITMEKAGRICCLSLIKADEFADMVKGLLSPIMKDLI
jgi:AbrB family looped-hinge helix DNA binding protein